jgi:hypothetical protein
MGRNYNNVDNEDDDAVRLKVYTTPQPRRHDWLQKIANQEASSTTNVENAKEKALRRHSIIQFGGSASAGQQQQYRGVRETYEYRQDSSGRPVVSYTRYGEGPVWYGLGRMVQLELTGKHYDFDIDDNDNDDDDNDAAAARRVVPIPTVLADFIPKDFWNKEPTTTGRVENEKDDETSARWKFPQQQQQQGGAIIGTWFTRFRSATSFSVGDSGRHDNDG